MAKKFVSESGIYTGINLNDLARLAKANPTYATMLKGLYQIDIQIKQFVADEMERHVDSSQYFIKTELMNQCYNLYLYYSERDAMVGVSWTLTDFLVSCENKTIEDDVKEKVRKMLKKFQEKKIMTGERPNWIY